MSTITHVVEWLLHGILAFIFGWAACEIRHSCKKERDR